MESYRYTESGLDNVFIEGMGPHIDDGGEEVYGIPNIIGLHRVISEAIVSHPAGMSGKELRFLRTEMGLTQAELARVVHRDTQTVGRWERGEHPMEGPAEALVRLLAIERLNLEVDQSTVAELSGRCVPTARSQPIRIDGHDPDHYRAIAA